MSDGDYAALKASLRVSGYDATKPVVLYEGHILDGWHRWKAATRLGLRPPTRDYQGTTPLEYVLGENLVRRHLNESGRALIAARLANLPKGANRFRKVDSEISLSTLSQSEAATRLNVHAASVKSARRVLEAGTADLIAAVETEQLAVSVAADLAELPPSQQARVTREVDPKRRKDLARTLAKQGKALRHTRRHHASEAPALTLTTQAREPARGYYTVERWQKLDPAARADIIAAGFESTGTGSLNEQTGDSIEWARWSHNTVTGCLHDCPYCYARDIAERLYPQKFVPTFHPARLGAPAHVIMPADKAARDPAYRNIFANSMSDLFGQWVPRDWIEATLTMARRNPTWNFLTLTKFPQRAVEFDFPDNWWLGTTIDAQARVANAEKAFAQIRCRTKWLSVEPMLQPLRFARLELFHWVVIGGASASQHTPAWIPPFEWIAELQGAARRAGCRIYHKTNLDLGDGIRVREFPWSTPAQRRLPKAFWYLKGLNGAP